VNKGVQAETGFFFEQVVAIRDIIRPPTRENFNDVYIVYELMDTDLHQIIRSNQALTEDHCQVCSATFPLGYASFYRSLLAHA
jgi:hypothetical protein